GVGEGGTIDAGVPHGEGSDVAVPLSAAPPLMAYGKVPLPSGETPLVYAGFWLRAVAYLIDSAIVGLAFAAIAAILAATVGLHFFRGHTPGVYAETFFVRHE